MCPETSSFSEGNLIGLTAVAQQAVQDFPGSDIEVALAFCECACPAFVAESNDRLVKVGRSVRSLIELYCTGSSNESTPSSSLSCLEECLKLVQQECELIASRKLQVPKVPFGKTGIEMPVVTLGCMRFQQEWGPRIKNMNMVGSDCQDNLFNLMKYAVAQLGMNHIETARGYGSSELQLGVVLKQLSAAKLCRREDLIIQTKVKAFPNSDDFRQALETSMKSLQVDYLDLFAFHGLNLPLHIDWVFGTNRPNGENCYDVVLEFIKAGKIRHLGFSTHASTETIKELINTNVFEYVNIHYHYFGSYTGTAGGHDGNGNLDCVKLAREKNMGVFIISPFDKGGMLYAPSKQLRKLTLPEMEPMAFMSNWIWNHHNIYDDGKMPQIHTYTVGAARPSDLDQPAVAAYLHMTQNDIIVSKTKKVMKRLNERRIQALGQEWVHSWWKGLPKNDKCLSRVEHTQIVWMYNNIKAFGMYEFARARYKSLENNYFGGWDEHISAEDNIEKILEQWGWTPGLPLLPSRDYSDDLKNVPIENKKRVAEAEMFVYYWCRNKSHDKKGDNDTDSAVENPKKKSRVLYKNYGLTADEENQVKVLSVNEEACNKIPDEWKTAYEMKPWPDFPDRPRKD